MELCSGGDLCDCITARGDDGFSLAELQEYNAELLCAVAYLHDRGITHRDVKPENILLDPGLCEVEWSLKLCDFGIAAACPRGGSLRGYGTVMYMSPEQLVGYCNEACDVWACGCVFYEMLTRGHCLMPKECSVGFEDAHAFVRSERFDERLAVGVAMFGDAFEGVVLLCAMLALEWSNRCTAVEALGSGYFSGTSCVDRTRVRGDIDIVARESGQQSPPPFVPVPWDA